jgi:hypothetical protein
MADQPASSEAQQPPDAFPVPDHFILTPVLDGAYGKHLPTVTAIYIGCAARPEGLFLMGMVSVALEPHDTEQNKICLHLFIEPDEIEEEDIGATVFAETAAFELAAEVKVIQEFWDNVRKVKVFTLAISSDDYFFSCRVDYEGATVSDVKCDWRYLN